jgi:hypothetical protein
MRMRACTRFGLVAVLALSGSIVACGGDEGAGGAGENGPNGPNGAGANGGNGVQLGPDGMPVGPDGKPLPPKLDGRYEVSSEFDLTTAGLLPEVMNDTLKALSNFREHPSQTIFDLADAAGVPVVPNVLNAIPGPIRGLVLGFVDEHVIKALYGAVPVTQKITGLLDDLGTIATRFELVTTLDLPMPDASGDARAKHTIAGVGYRWDNKRHVINAPELLTKLVEQPVKANAVLLEKRTPELETGRLMLRDHTFSVPIGTFAVYAADELAKDKFDAKDLRDAVGKFVDCEKLADDVSKRCIDPIGPGKICVDHKSEIKQLCTTGLDLVVGAVKGAIKGLDIPVLQLKDGVAQMWDAPAPGGALDATIDRIDHGFWTAEVNVGKNHKPLIATFSGKRVGDTKDPSGATR